MSKSSPFSEGIPTTEIPDSSAAPTRSEIENALSGRTKVNPKKARQIPSAEFDLNVPPRRQQVIGGNLSGVSNKPKFGIFSRYGNMSIINWSAVVIVCLILLAFFWPQNKKSTLETTSPELTNQIQLGETDLSIDEQTELLKNENGSDVLSFSRDDDLDRAGDYRAKDAQDLQIRALLDQAKIRISKGQLLKPADASALASYRSVLEISPNNPSAKEGLDYLTSRFMSAGYSALEKDKVAIAQTALASLKKIDANSDEYEEFGRAIETWRINKAVDDLLSQAQTALKQEDLILPARENALYFFQQALNMAPENDAAREGIRNIADAFVGKANAAAIAGDYQAANAHLATVSIIDPTHESIEQLELVIARAEKTRAERMAQKAASQEESQLQTAAEIQESPSSEGASFTQPTDPSSARTSRSQTREQQAFDKQYLKQGLEAYYQGDYTKASALLQPLADKGVARAQFRLAYMYYLGRGFSKNTKIADTMIRAALPAIQKFADEGRAWAQSDLGSLYEDGLVLRKNYREAVRWYTLSAEQGYPGAQTNLGIMYARGRGVVASRRKAIRWFQRAAKQGDEIAKRNLTTLGIK